MTAELRVLLGLRFAGFHEIASLIRSRSSTLRPLDFLRVTRTLPPIMADRS